MQRGRPVRGIALWLAGTIILAMPGCAAAQMLNGLLTTSTSLTSGSGDAGASRSRTVNQILEVNWSRTVSPRLGYRVSLRASDVETAASSKVATNWGSTQTVEPNLDLSLTGPKYSLNGGIRFREEFSDASQSERRRTDENSEFLRFFWTPSALTQLTFQYDRAAATDDQSPKQRDTADQRFLLGAQYKLAQLSMNYSLTEQFNDDRISGRKREQRTQIGTASYADTFWKGRLSLNANYLVNYVESIEKLQAVSGGTPGVSEHPILGVLSGLEPEAGPDAANYPLGGTSALNDGNTASGIALAVNQNVAGRADGISRRTDTSIVAELTGGLSVSLIRLTVGSDPADTLALADHVSLVLPFFKLYASQDNLGWSEIAAGSITRTFDAAASRIDFSFPAVTARFFKVVLADDPRPPASRDLLATELSLQGPAAAGAGQTRLTTRTLRQTGSAGFSLQPWEMVTLSYHASITNHRQDPNQVSDTSGSQGVSLSGAPHKLLTAGLSYQNNFTRTDRVGGEETDSNSYGLTTSFMPLPTLNHTLNITRAESSRNGILGSRSHALAFATAARPYRLLTTDLNFTASRSKSFSDGAESFSYSVNLSANARLRPRLTTVGSYGYQHTDTSGATAASTGSHSVNVSSTYTLSRLVNFNARVDYQDSVGSRSVNQQYRIDWIPTPKTSVFLGVQRNDQFGATGGFTQGLTASGRWNLSQLLDLSLSYSFSRAANGDFVHNGSGTMSLRF